MTKVNWKAIIILLWIVALVTLSIFIWKFCPRKITITNPTDMQVAVIISSDSYEHRIVLEPYQSGYLEFKFMDKYVYVDCCFSPYFADYLNERDNGECIDIRNKSEIILAPDYCLIEITNKTGRDIEIQGLEYYDHVTFKSQYNGKIEKEYSDTFQVSPNRTGKIEGYSLEKELYGGVVSNSYYWKTKEQINTPSAGNKMKITLYSYNLESIEN